jgi:hypothetical protein
MTSLHQLQPGGATALDRVRGKAPVMRANVRRLAAFASVHSCPTAAVAFAARIDTNKVLAGTRMQMPFGQSPFAIGRGVAFEALLRRHGHAELRRVLTDGLGTDFSYAAIENLREGYPPNRTGLRMRATITQTRMAEIAGQPQEPVILDGAVLQADVGGIPAFFEADEMAIGVGGQIIVGENKSWPVVDGKPTDEDALGAALDQAATYVLLGRRTLEQQGVDPAKMADSVVLVTPRNTGLGPSLHRQDVASRVRRIQRLLDAVPDVQETAASTPMSVTFDEVADTEADESARLASFRYVTDVLGRVYEPASCLTSCGFAWACRERLFEEGDPSVVGGPVARALPGIASLRRVAELGQGAPPSAAEAPAAAPLARAGRLYDGLVPAAGQAVPAAASAAGQAGRRTA